MAPVAIGNAGRVLSPPDDPRALDRWGVRAQPPTAAARGEGSDGGDGDDSADCDDPCDDDRGAGDECPAVAAPADGRRASATPPPSAAPDAPRLERLGWSA